VVDRSMDRGGRRVVMWRKKGMEEGGVSIRGSLAMEGVTMRRSRAMGGKLAMDGGQAMGGVSMKGNLAMEGVMMRRSRAMGGKLAMEGVMMRRNRATVMSVLRNLEGAGLGLGLT